MTDDPKRILIGIDWRSTGLAVGVIAAVIFAAWAAWTVLSWLFGTTMGRAVLGLAILVAALYVILTDDVDLDDALNEPDAGDEPPPDTNGDPSPGDATPSEVDDDE